MHTCGQRGGKAPGSQTRSCGTRQIFCWRCMHATSESIYLASSEGQSFELSSIKTRKYLSINRQCMGNHTFPCKCVVPYIWEFAGTGEKVHAACHTVLFVGFRRPNVMVPAGRNTVAAAWAATWHAIAELKTLEMPYPGMPCSSASHAYNSRLA